MERFVYMLRKVNRDGDIINGTKILRKGRWVGLQGEREHYLYSKGLERVKTE